MIIHIKSALGNAAFFFCYRLKSPRALKANAGQIAGSNLSESRVGNAFSRPVLDETRRRPTWMLESRITQGVPGWRASYRDADERSEYLVCAAHALAFSRLQFSIFLIGLSDVQTWTSGQGEVFYKDVTFRRSDIKDD
ncbi:MAG: hypothetical protein CL579_17760 [Alteromonadaceae bacterium]|nr:hypothetical protein [Alteromonadaceae bacterium]